MKKEIRQSITQAYPIAAMFTIAITTSLVAVSSLIGSAHAIAVVAKKNRLNMVLLHKPL